MSQTAAHLVDHVIPHVPVRQWVLSMPIPLRLLLAAQPEPVPPVLANGAVCSAAICWTAPGSRLTKTTVAP